MNTKDFSDDFSDISINGYQDRILQELFVPGNMLDGDYRLENHFNKPGPGRGEDFIPSDVNELIRQGLITRVTGLTGKTYYYLSNRGWNLMRKRG